LATFPDFLYAALDTTACAAFIKESRMKFVSANKLHRKSGFSPRIARTTPTSMARTPASTALSDLAIGSCATLATLELPEEIQGQLMHLGFVPESRVLALRRAPAGDPTVYCVDGAEVALRKETAKFISVHSVFVAVRKDAR
jgi:ferrous iron transport protein A